MQYSSDDNIFLAQLLKQKKELQTVIPQLVLELNSTRDELLQTQKMITLLQLQIERKSKCLQ